MCGECCRDLGCLVFLSLNVAGAGVFRPGAESEVLLVLMGCNISDNYMCKMSGDIMITLTICRGSGVVVTTDSGVTTWTEMSDPAVSRISCLDLGGPGWTWRLLVGAR